MTWQRTTDHVLAIPASEVWEVVGDPRRWPSWCAAIGSFTLESEYADAPLSSGLRGHYLPSTRWAAALHRRTAPALRVSEVDPGHSLCLEQPTPGGSMRVRWDLRAHAEGHTVLRQQVRVTGWSSLAVVLAVAEAIVTDWPLAVTRLYRMLRPAPTPGALKVVIAGGSGVLGRSVAGDLSTRGHDVVLLTRRINAYLPHRQVEWDGRTVGPWATELTDDPSNTALINLAGRLVDARPTEANITELRQSRVRPTRALVEACHDLDPPLARWVQGSTTAIWSDAGENRLTESSPLPTGDAALPQMTGVAAPWEAAVEGANTEGATSEGANTEHLTILRTSIVLEPGSPAFDRLAALTWVGLGGRVGSGQQWFSWIHVDDWLSLVRAALGLEPEVALPGGVLVAAAPHPVRNVELMALLRERLHRPAAPPTPPALVRLGGILLRTDPALGLTGRHATSELLTEAGFEFAYPTLEGALRDLTS